MAIASLLAAEFLGSSTAWAEEIASDWVDAANARTRLTAVRDAQTGMGGEITAFVEIELPPGWKTYWKAPGDSGVPPSFDWTGSANVAEANVLYPVPHRLVDKGGETLGYKDRVAFPVRVKASEDGRPIALAVAVEFGICKDICIPNEVKLSLDVPPGESGELSDLAGVSLAAVPRAPQAAKPEDPVLKGAHLDTSNGKPLLVIEAEFPGGSDKADVFLDAPSGAYLPPARKTSGSGSALTFAADLSQDVDLEELKGQAIGITLVGAGGQTATSFVLE